jgi:ring-1,2-phenylacetyl-CoA epoxidase subunit PaaE
VLLRARIGGTVLSRPYSVCSGVTDGELRIAVRQLPGGRMSSWVNTVLQPGDVVDVAPPSGSFATDLDGLAARHVLGIAAGSGITPVISLLSSVLAREPASRCTLLYGNRSSASTLFAARLAGLQERYPDRLRVVHLRSREITHPPVLPGRIDREVLRMLADRGELGGVDEAYICGPGAMTTEARECLVDDLGLPPQRVHTETFSAARPPRAPKTLEGTVHLRHGGVEHAVPVAAGESILDAGLRAGIDLPYSCRAGACGTCSATLRHRAAEEGAGVSRSPGAGTVVRTCQTGPLRDVTVDFDAVSGVRGAATADDARERA